MERFNQNDLAAILAHAKAHGWRSRTPSIGMKICAIIEREARRQDITARELVAKAGVHHDVFGRWRRGETQPSVRIIERLERAGVKIF